MNQAANFGASFQSGIAGALGIMDQLDRRQERKDDREAQKVSRIEQKRVAMKNEKRNDQLWEQRQEDRELQLSDRETQRSDADIARTNAAEDREYQLELRPMQEQIRRMELSNAYSQAEIHKATAQYKQQEVKAGEAARIAAQASAYLEGGDLDAADKTFAELEAYGFPVPALKAGFSDELMKGAQQIMNGEVDIESPEASALLAHIVNPALTMSGRDTEKFEFAKLKRTKAGTFAIYMKDKENGRMVPATLLASSNDTDLATEITSQQLMVATQNMVSLGRQIQSTNQQTMRNSIQGAMARSGVEQKPAGKSDPRIQIEQMKQQAANAEANRERFVESFIEPGSRGVANLLASEENFDSGQASKVVAATTALMEDNEELSPNQALALHRNNEVIQEQTSLRAQEMMAQHEGLSGSDAQELASMLIRNPGNAKKVASRIEKLQKNAANKAKRAAESEKRTEQSKQYKSQLDSMLEQGSDNRVSSRIEQLTQQSPLRGQELINDDLLRTGR